MSRTCVGDNPNMITNRRRQELRELIYPPSAFSRLDDTDDSAFYAPDRLVPHLDAHASEVVSRIVGTLAVEERPAVLDLMASWDSHVPEGLATTSLVGLGLNRNELARNAALSLFTVQDINKVPALPFDSGTFDVVLNTVSVDYLTRPFEVFREVGRVLKPGGLFLVVFSNRMFPEKAVRVWREAGEEERLMIVQDYFDAAECFERPRQFIYQGRPRPKDDKYALYGIPSDPVFAVFADKRGAPAGRAPRPDPTVTWESAPDESQVAERKPHTKHDMACPYCGVRLRKWQVPLTPFSEWDQEFLYVCFHDACPYVLRGWDAMARQGNIGSSYRLAYARERDTFAAIPIPHMNALKESIVDD